MNFVNVRELFGFTQQEMAQYIGVSVRTLQNWEYRDCCPNYLCNLLIKLAVLEGRSNQTSLDNQRLDHP